MNGVTQAHNLVHIEKGHTGQYWILILKKNL